jgi:hypothetical protein
MVISNVFSYLLIMAHMDQNKYLSNYLHYVTLIVEVKIIHSLNIIDLFNELIIPFI